MKSSRFLFSAALAAANLLWLSQALAQPVPAKGRRGVDPAHLALTIDVDGKPADIRCANPQATKLCAVLVQAVSGWRFAPAQRHGVPEARDVFLSLYLVATPKDGGFELHATLAELSLRGPTEDSLQVLETPAYPHEPMMRGQTAVVEAELIADADRGKYRVGQLWVNGKLQSGRRNGFASSVARAAESTRARAAPAELLVECVVVVFSFNQGGGEATPRRLCQDTYIQGFVPPKMLTDATTARF